MAHKLMYGMTAEQIIKAAPDWATHVSAGGFEGSSFLLYESAEFFQSYCDMGLGGLVKQLHGNGGIVDVALPLNELHQLKELPDEWQER